MRNIIFFVNRIIIVNIHVILLFIRARCHKDQTEYETLIKNNLDILKLI